MNFDHPITLLLLPPLIAGIALLGRVRLGRMPWLRATLSLALRLALIVLLVAALAGPRSVVQAAGINVVFVVDRSAAVGPQIQQQERDWLAAALRAMHAGDRASTVIYGGNASWSGVLPGKSLPTFPSVDAQSSNIQSALQLALGSLPADQPSRIVLLSNGRQTSGDALQAAQQAAQEGVPISVIPLNVSQAPDVAVTAVDLPAAGHPGDQDTLRVTVQSNYAVKAQLRLSVDGVPSGSQTFSLKPGANTFLFAQTLPTQPGTHRYRVEASAPNDSVPQNNMLETATVVQQVPRVLLLAGNPSASGALAAVLRAGDMNVTTLAATRAPTSVDAVAAYDAVVLADVPAADLSAEATAALRAAVYDRGRGLLVAGGTHSFAAGGYAAGALQPILPVTSEAEAHGGRSQVGLVLIIDKSGSMSEAANGVTKVSMAQQAVVDAVQHLQPKDQFGVLAFDDTTHVVVPFGSVGTRNQQDAIRQEILALQPFGDTVMYPAMRQAARWLFNSKATFKHIVLLTDGQGEPAQYLPLIKLMQQNNISLSTIGIGADAEVDELRSWAAAGNGRFYYTADPHDIPRLVVQETRIGTGPTYVSGTIGVHQAAESPALRSLSGQKLPPVLAYNITAARTNSQVILQSALGDPLFAQWQVGLGRVAVWTAGSDPTWAGAWMAQRNFWSDAVRGLMSHVITSDMQPTLTQNGGTLQIGADVLLPQGGFANLLTTQADVTLPDGRTQSIPMTEDAPGHYTASMPATQQGVYIARIVQSDGTATVRQASGAAVVPYAPVYMPAPPDLSLLSAIAAAGNAPTLSQPGEAFNAAGLQPRYTSQDLWPILVLIALLLFPFDVAMRVLYTPPAPYDPRNFSVP